MSEEGNSAKKSFTSNFNKRRNQSTTVSHISSKDVSREITHLDNTPVSKFHKKSPSAANFIHKVGNIKVVCRVRPLNKKEKELKDAMILEIVDEKSLTYKNPIPYSGSPSYQFTFDRVFGPESAQQDIYEAISRPIVESAFEGFNGTILTYGQTGSGKTYTMQGLLSDRNPDAEGIMPRMAHHIFERMKDVQEGAQPVVKFSAIELYSEKIKDLLKSDKTSLKIRQDKSKGISIEDLTEIVSNKKEDLLGLFKTSMSNRSNPNPLSLPGASSKSHMIVMITISQNNIQDLSGKSGKICLADLADYEKMSKASNDTRMTTSAKLVNKSLCTLGNIIKLLSESKNNQHIPYRESNLTRILQDSLGGNSKTSLLITCSPSKTDYLETLQTLKFGLRARRINNAPKLNTELTIPSLQKLLTKANKENEEKNRRIAALENMLKENGLFLNLSVRDDNSTITENKSDIMGDNNVPSIMGDLESELLEPEEFLNKTLSDFSDIAPDHEDIEEENVLELQKSLEEEQRRSKELAEKNEELVRELEETKEKLFEAERDIQAMTRKLSLSSMKVQGFEIRVKQRDQQIDKLEDFRNNLLEENKELQRKLEHYVELLKAEEENIDQLNNLSIQRKLKEFDLNMSQESPLLKPDAEKDEGELKIEGVINKMAKAVALKFGVKEQKEIDSLSNTLLERFKSLLELQGTTDPKREAELTLEINNLKQDNENLRKDVDLHKGKYEELLKDFEGILRDYENVARGRFPLFDKILETMVKAALTKARNSFEDQKNILMKGIQDKMFTLKNMENRLEEQHRKHRSLQHKLDEGQKENMQKLKNLQNQLFTKLSPGDMPKRSQTLNEKDGSGIKKKDLKMEIKKAILNDMGSLRTSLRKQSTSGNKENESAKLNNIVQSSAIKISGEPLADKPVLASSATLKQNRNKNKKFTVDDVDFNRLNSLKRKLDFTDENQTES